MVLTFTRNAIPWHAFLYQTGNGVCTVYVKATAGVNTNLKTLVPLLQHAPHFSERLPEVILSANKLTYFTTNILNNLIHRAVCHLRKCNSLGLH